MLVFCASQSIGAFKRIRMSASRLAFGRIETGQFRQKPFSRGARSTDDITL